MADTKDTEEQKESKYWIKAGCSAEHVNCPGMLIIVDHVITEKKTVEGTDGPKEKIFTLGWQCHWVTKEGRIQKGVLHTNELAKPLAP